MGCDSFLEYSLSVKHSEWIGITFSAVSSLFLYVYVLMTLITNIWRTPLLNRTQTKILVGPQRRMMVILFTLSLPIMDVSTIYSWRLLPGHAGCPPPADYFLLWVLTNILNVVTMTVAWFYVPYAQVMIYLPQVLYTILAAFYILMSIARDHICGTTFVVLIPLVLGLVCVYFVPLGMRISRERLGKRVEALHDIAEGAAKQQGLRRYLGQDRDSHLNASKDRPLADRAGSQ